MGEFTCSKSDRLVAAHVGFREEAVVYFDGKPILFLAYSARWRCDHTITYVEREAPTTHDCLEAITFLKEPTLVGFLDRVWDALNEHDNALIH
jgi:hypothetical protein